MTKTRVLVVLCAALIAVASCKKKEGEEGGAKDQPAAADKMAGGDKTAGGDKMAGGDKAAPAAGGAISTPADYEAKSTDLMTKISAVFTADGKDCDKLGADLGKFFTDNKATFDAIDAFEKSNADAKKAFNTKTKAQQDDIGGKMGAAGDACKDNKAFMDMMAKIPG
jgi:hypothetical protein